MSMASAGEQRIHRLWDELADFEASQPELAAAHLMASLCGLANAWNATWAGAIRVDAHWEGDPLQGWRVAAVQALHPVAPHPDDGHFKEILKVWDRRDIDPFISPPSARGRVVPNLFVAARICRPYAMFIQSR
jgi:hypothetical protein